MLGWCREWTFKHTQDWIDAATEVLTECGLDSVRLDALATQLEVTRGSLDWHFRDREELLRRVLQSWRERTTEQLIQRLENASNDPVELLRDIISHTDGQTGRGSAAALVGRTPDANGVAQPLTIGCMSEHNQIIVPTSFIALFVEPGRTRPNASRDEIAARYEFCEDLATMLTDTAANKLWELGVTEDDVLERVHRGLVGPDAPVSAAEAIWVIRRLAELLGWNAGGFLAAQGIAASPG